MKIQLINIAKAIIVLSMLHASLYLSFRPAGYSATRLAVVAMLLTAGLLIIVAFMERFERRREWNQYSRIIYSLLLLWITTMIARALSTDLVSMQSMWGLNFTAWAWLAPLMIFFGGNLNNWLKLFAITSVMLVVACVLTVSVLLFDPSLAGGVKPWFLVIPFLALTYRYQPTNVQHLVLVSLLIFCLLSLSLSLRETAFYLLLLACCYTFEGLRGKSRRGMLLVIIILGLSPVALYAIEYVLSNDRLLVDTRSFLFRELFSDLSFIEEIFGRGVMGRYYSEYFNLFEQTGLEGGDVAARISMEVGYLNMILKGGWIVVILHLCLMLPAAYLGILRSNNIVARMCGYVVLIYLFLWLVSFPPMFSPDFLLLWMSIGTCISSRARSISNESITMRMGTRRVFIDV